MVILFFKPFLKKKKKYYIHVALKDRAKKINKNKLNKIMKKAVRETHTKADSTEYTSHIYVLDNVHPFPCIQIV